MASIVSNGCEIYYERTGHGPELVLVHGLGGDVRQWAPLAGKLKDDFTLTAFDMRGSGRSANSEAPYTIGLMADDTAEIIEKICGGSALVLGFSMGGAVALELALSRPELVKGLVLVSTLPSWNGPFPPSDAVKKLFGQTEMTRELLARVYDAVFGSEYKEKVSADEYVDYRLNDEYPQPLSSYLNQLGALEKFNLADSISTISARTLIVAGSEDRVVPPQNALWMAERIPRSEMEIFKGAGHMLPIEMPGRLAAKILAWTPQG